MRQHFNFPIILQIFIIIFSLNARAEIWPVKAEETGLVSPEPKKVIYTLSANGIYIPQIEGLSNAQTIFVQGNLVWNFTLCKKLTLFGAHNGGVMHFDNVTLINTGSRFGVRFLGLKNFSLETAYLHHKVDTTFVDGIKIYPAGVFDRGVETGMWISVDRIRNILFNFHLFGRYFSVYTEDQLVGGYAFELLLLPKDGLSLTFGVEFLEVFRLNKRTGVDFFTHNAVGKIEWKMLFNNSTGMFAGIRMSSDLLTGSVPMLELKRSMIGEPMGYAELGIFSGF
jgi:hypothetical protein